jgi:hypothetical protein
MGDNRLVSGKTPIEGWLESHLLYTTLLVKPGLLKVRYSKDTMYYNDMFTNGEFTIVLNNQLLHFDDEQSLDKWKEVSFALEEGPTSIEIIYEKYNGEDEDS